jgi:hypothetical protein
MLCFDVSFLKLELRRIDMAINWEKNVDDALLKAKEQDKPLLLDFSAAPM